MRPPRDTSFRSTPGNLFAPRVGLALPLLTLATIAGCVCWGVEAHPEDAWSCHFYDLRPLLEHVAHFESPYSTGYVSPLPHVRNEQVKEMEELLKDATGREHWEPIMPASMRYLDGQVFVRQRESVHKRLREVMAALSIERRRQVRLRVRIAKTSENKLAWSAKELSALAEKKVAESEMPSAELVCYNAQSAVAYSGREHSFVESVSTGGEGYFINGVREAVGSPLLEGLSVIVRPLILPGDKEIEVTLRLSNTSRVSFRKPTVLEKVAMEMAHVPVHLPDPMNPDQEREVQERAELFSIPNRDATRVGTQVVVPKGEWTLAGKLVSPDDPTVRLLALVAVELLEGK